MYPSDEILFYSSNEDIGDELKKYVADELFKLKELLFKDDKKRILYNKYAKITSKISPQKSEELKVETNNLSEPISEKISSPERVNYLPEPIPKKNSSPERVNYLPEPIPKKIYLLNE